MSDIPTENYIAHLSSFLEDQDNPLSDSFRYYIEFLRFATIQIEQRKFPRVVVKFFKEKKKKDNPRGLRVGELSYALNMAWSPTGKLIIKKTTDPKVFIIRFSNAGDFAAAIYSIPNRVHGKLLTMGQWSSDIKIEDVDFNAQDYWIKFNLRGDLVEKGFVAEMVAEKVGRVLNLVGPNNLEGEYKDHVLVDITKALVHQIKIIIIEGTDRETIKMKIFFLEIPHGTCRDCWHLDGDHLEEKCREKYIEYQKNFPKYSSMKKEKTRM
ncbi:hypothetical protein MKW98_029397 [Papaver atlanticum]|uniref:Uncharacterized protein n=1 Tax=Papaver atlanticum TaxID=357466 RepID=A0AAD4XFN4_9MAGN|nr:hypothetical protein MKW98_029397 [Papaver atlanticum]